MARIYAQTVLYTLEKTPCPKEQKLELLKAVSKQTKSNILR